MSALVECHSGLEYAGRPTALRWQDEWLEVEAVEAEWRTPEGKRFRVRTTDGQVFELVYVELQDEWQIYQSETNGEGRKTKVNPSSSVLRPSSKG